MSREAIAEHGDRNLDQDAHPRALFARAQKRETAISLGIDETYIAAFVDRFYARVRQDDQLGPIFSRRIHDWPAHLERMKSFWRSILHNTGEFAGNPMLKHMLIPGLDGRLFSHWLSLFYKTLRELEPGQEATQIVGNRARLIADSLLTGIETRKNGLGGARAGKDLPHV